MSDPVPATPSADTSQSPPPEYVYRNELEFLGVYDSGPRPPGWRLTPNAVVTFLTGSGSEQLKLPRGAKAPEGMSRTIAIEEKFVGDRAIVERAVVTLAGERGLLLVGEPGTAKSMLSELLAAAISGTSCLTVQGTAGTTEDQLRYGWNYSLLLARGPSQEALVPSPILTAMRHGRLARVEEITRCLPEVQDSLVSILSDRRLAVPELGDHTEQAARGFNIIATANLRDRGVSEMSAALKRRFNFEVVSPIADATREAQLVRKRATQALERIGQALQVDDSVVGAIVTAFRDLRNGVSSEGWTVERPSTVMSVAEAVSVTTAIGIQTAYFPGGRDPLNLLPGYLLGVVMKDDPKDRGKLLAYWDGAVKRRAETQRLWKQLQELRRVLEEA